MTQKSEDQEHQENNNNKQKSNKLKSYHDCNDSPQKYFQTNDEKHRCEKCQKYLSTQKLDVCFQLCKIEHNGEQIISYLFLLKYSFFILVILVIVYTLPLSLICNKFKMEKQSEILNNLSMMALAENDKLSYLTFFLLPIFVIYSVLFLLLSYKIRMMNRKNDQLKRFPTNHAALLTFPKPISSQDQIAQCIESWFYSQIKHNPLCLELLPQLLKDQSQNSEQSSSSQDQPETLASRIIQKVVFSYNYEEYQTFLQEIDYFSNEIKKQRKQVDVKEVEKYLNIYNIKKNIAKNMSFLKYCVVIFKNSKYAEYFIQKTNAIFLQFFFSPEKYRILKDGDDEIAVQSNVFPTEVYWQKMHFNDAIIFKKSLYSNAIWLLCLAIGCSIQYSLTFLRLSNVFILSNQMGTILVSSIIINLIQILFSILIHTFTKRQIFITYAKQKKSYIMKMVVLNVITLTIIPFITHLVHFPSNFYLDEGGYLSSQIINLSTFIFFSILMMYLPQQISEIQRDKQYQSKKIIKTQYKLASILTIISMTMLIAPILPIIICIPTFCLFLYNFLEKFNISFLYDQASERGSELIKQIIPSFYNIFILYLLSFTLFYFFNGYTQQWKIQDLVIIIITFILFLIIRFSNLNYLQDKLFCCFKEQSSIDVIIVDEDYSKIKSNFLMEYQDYNFLFNYQLKQNFKNNDYSERMKIYQQLNTMSKTLSLSLKQKLFSNSDPIIKNQIIVRKDSQQDQVNEIYFQYEQKITMTKTKPKIPIPPLFKRQDPSARKEQSKVEMANFNSIFSDSEQKKKVKKTIKNNLKFQNQIKK